MEKNKKDRIRNEQKEMINKVDDSEKKSQLQSSEMDYTMGNVKKRDRGKR